LVPLPEGEGNCNVKKIPKKNNFPPVGEIQRGRCIVLTLTLGPSPKGRGNF